MQFNNIRNYNNRTLDLVLCNKSLISCVDRSEFGLVDEDRHHPSLEFYIKEITINPLDHGNRNVFDFNKADYMSINNDLAGVEWENLFLDRSLEEAVNLFYLKIKAVIDNYVPSFKIKGKYPVYFKLETIRTINEKNKYHKKYKRFNDRVSYLTFTRLRRQSKQMMRGDFYDFVRTSESRIQTDAKKLWSYVSSKKRSHVSVPQSLYFEGHIASGGRNVSNLFADFFKSVYETTNDDNMSLKVRSHGDDSLVVTSDRVIDIIRGLDLRKSPGPDGIPPVFIKNCMLNIATPLCIIFNLSLKTAHFPERWKMSHIVPLHKSGERTDAANYRPISKLSVFAKILEKIVYAEILTTVKNLIIEEQHGFCPHKSLETNLLCYSQNICQTIDNQDQMDCVYTDFSKAFDKISHNILAERLAGVGVNAGLLQWVWSYICHRKQVVVVNGYQSEPFTATSGVPQGSHLGPLFFIIYINNIKECFSNTKFLLYADDLKIFRKIDHINDCHRLQEDLDKLFTYCKNNSLFLNLKKCQSITFSKKKILINHNYSINNHELEKVSKIKDLGVILDNQWTFKLHFDKIVAEANKMLGFINRTCKEFKSPNTFLTLYHSYVCSKLSFASVIWHPNYNIHSKRIESIQNKFLKKLAFKSNKPIEIVKHEFKIIPLAQKRIISDLCVIYKIINFIIDSPFLLSCLHFKVPGRDLRHSDLFNIPFCRTNLGQNTPMIRMQTEFNKYCKNIDVFSTTLNAFKKQLKTHFLEL